MRLEVVATEEADVVRRDHGHAARRGELDRAAEIRALAGASEPLHLDVEALRQQRAPVVEDLGRARIAARRERATELAGLRTRKPDQTLERADGKPLLEHDVAARDHPARGAAREQRAQALEAQAALAQQRQPCRLAVVGRLRNPDIRADQRLDAAVERGAIELHERRDVALIGDRTGRHPELVERVDERVDAHDAVDERVLGVDAQMDEAGHGRPLSSSSTSRAAAALASQRS